MIRTETLIRGFKDELEAHFNEIVNEPNTNRRYIEDHGIESQLDRIVESSINIGMVFYVDEKPTSFDGEYYENCIHIEGQWVKIDTRLDIDKPLVN